MNRLMRWVIVSSAATMGVVVLVVLAAPQLNLSPALVWQFDVAGNRAVIDVSPNGKLLAVAVIVPQDPQKVANEWYFPISGIVEVWDIKSRRRIAHIDTMGGVQSIEFTSDGKRLIGAMNGRMEYNATASNELAKANLILWDFTTDADPITAALPDRVDSAAVSQDDQVIGTILGSHFTGARSLLLWSFKSLTTGKLDRIVLGNVDDSLQRDSYSAVFTTGQRLVVTSYDPRRDACIVTLWDVNANTRIAEFGAGPSVVSIAGKPDGKAFALCDVNLGLVIDSHGKELCPWTNPPQLPGPAGARPQPLTWHPHRDLVAVGGTGRGPFGDKDGKAVIYEMPTWKPRGIAYINEEGTAITSLEFADNGETLVTASGDGSIRCWSVRKLLGE